MRIHQGIFVFYLMRSIIIYSSVGVLTNSRQWDGFGAQYLLLIGSLIDAELKQCEFKYTPFTKMEHNYTNDSHFLEKKEWLINFIGNFDVATPGGTPIAACNYHHREDGGAIIANSASLQKAKKLFRANKQGINRIYPDGFNIAVHVRRPNSHDSRLDGSDTSDQLFLRIIAALRGEYHDKNPLFHIFSQGASEKFTCYEADDTILHIDETIEDSFISMVFADVLVAARSAFSYVAALISEGEIYYIPFGCKPLPYWISVYDLCAQT